MKATVKLNNTLIEVVGETQKELFAEMAQAHEVFSESECGLCKSRDIRPVIRHVPDGKKVHDYYEMICNKCRARLCFGQANEGGTLFPKRRLRKDPSYDPGVPPSAEDEDKGKFGPHNGWHKYRGDKTAAMPPADKNEKAVPF